MDEQPTVSQLIKKRIIKSFKWYLYPLIYFAVVGLVCAYAWYLNPVTHRAGIKIAFKTIGVIPTVLFVGTITVWLLVVILFLFIALRLKQSFPQLYQSKGFQWLLQISGAVEGQGSPTLKEKAPKTFRQRVASSVIYGIGLLYTCA